MGKVDQDFTGEYVTILLYEATDNRKGRKCTVKL